MTSIKTLTIMAALLAGGTSLALAQNGPPTGGLPPVAGGANGNPAVPGPHIQRPVPDILDTISERPAISERRDMQSRAIVHSRDML